ncbi:MAG TPA: DUF885 family protein [Planctomycetes bacterium]|nr:DUF885 family protein [Planctomycetota bacterium]HIL37446.1 DUF885 family protein [Planctomycetota bacterium]
MHFCRPIVPILALLPLCPGCSWRSQNATVPARLPGIRAADPNGLAEELFAERMDRVPRLADKITTRPARSDWGQEQEWTERPAFGQLGGIRIGSIDQALSTADDQERETLQRIRAELRFEALEPALTLDRAPLGPMRGLLRIGLLHLYLDHPLESGPDLEAFRARLEALTVWTLQAAERSKHVKGTQTPLPSTLMSLRAMASPALAEVILERVAQEARMAVDLTPSSRLQSMGEIETLLRVSLPAAATDLLAALEAPHRSQPRRGLVRQPGGLRLHRERVKQLVSADLTVTEIEARLRTQSRELEEALLKITTSINYIGDGLDLLAQLRDQHDDSVGHPLADLDRLELLTQRADLAFKILGPLLPADLGELPGVNRLPLCLRPLADGLLRQNAHHGRARARRLMLDPARLHAASMDSFAVSWILGTKALSYCDQPTSDLPRWLRHAQWPGWDDAMGLYLARLHDELKPGRDPWHRAAGLGLELECVARGLTDLGLHLHGWSRAEAIKFLQARCMAQPSRVELWVDDCLDRPGLALAAPLSLQEILAARADVRRFRGVAFDLLTFHRALLEVGPLPVDLTREEILRRLP